MDYKEILSHLEYDFVEQEVPVSKIVIDRELYPRTQLDTEVCEKYATALTLGEIFPEIVLTKDYVLIDGYHRLEATKKVGKDKIRALVLTQDIIDSERFVLAVELNLRHGKAFTDIDHEKIITISSQKNIAEDEENVPVMSKLFANFINIQDFSVFENFMDEDVDETEEDVDENDNVDQEENEIDLPDVVNLDDIDVPHEEEETEKETEEEEDIEMSEEEIEKEAERIIQKFNKEIEQESNISYFKIDRNEIDNINDNEKNELLNKGKTLTGALLEDLKNISVPPSNFEEIKSNLDDDSYELLANEQKEIVEVQEKIKILFNAWETQTIKLGKKLYDAAKDSPEFSENICYLALGHILSLIREIMVNRLEKISYSDFEFLLNSILKISINSSISSENIRIIEGIKNSLKVA